MTNERVGPEASFNVHSYRNQSLANGVYLWSKSYRFGSPAPVRFQPPEGATARSQGASAPGAIDQGASALGTRGSSGNAEAFTPDQPERIANPAVRVAIGFILISLLALAAMVGRRGHALDAFSAFALASCATLLVSPLAWGHYFMVQLPALLCVPIWLSRSGMPRAARIAALAPVVLSWSYYLAMPQFGGLGLLGLGTAGWFLGGCGLMCWVMVRGRGGCDLIEEAGAGVAVGSHQFAWAGRSARLSGATISPGESEKMVGAERRGIVRR